MNTEIKLSDGDDAYIIKNLWPLYQHDVSEFGAGGPNRHGVVWAEDNVRSLAEVAQGIDPWWKEPEALIPYLILADGQPAGFNLIAARSRLPQGIDADFVVHEFFVLHAFRGQGVAERAAALGFERHRGEWEVVTWPENKRGVAFWRRAIGSYTDGRLSEDEMDHTWGRRTAFRFNNA